MIRKRSKNVFLRSILFIAFAVFVQSNELIDSNTSRWRQSRSFTVDYEGNTFLKDGEPFRFVSGSFHYFRAMPQTWQHKLKTIRASGLNAVTTYVEWSLHNPKPNVYNWEGIANLVRFIKLAQKEDLLVILRPGPYICAERDMGGLPYWLLTKYPNIQLRTHDANYLSEVRRWYSELMPHIMPHLYGNGGPIIMVQIENEYGSFGACDRQYMRWLRNETYLYVGENAVLFTTDGPGMLDCGHVEGALPTIDFGASTNTTSAWQTLRKYLPKGPLVNSEYYPGWLTHWQEPMQRVSTPPLVKTLSTMLEQGANVNFYMFYGGTNFGFTAGANDGGPGHYNADVTSYDYDAPMDEAGDATAKYFAISDEVLKFLPLPNVSVPLPLQKKAYGTISLTPCCSILSAEGRKHLSSGVAYADRPYSFEALNQNSGLVLYETDLVSFKKDPSLLKVDKVHDRAYVYVDRNFIGVLSRESQVTSLPINAESGRKLQIVVESQGRINYKIPNDFKGILSEVVLGTKILKLWNMTSYPLDNYDNIDRLIQTQTVGGHRLTRVLSNKSLLRTGPVVFYGSLNIEGDHVYDTYLDPTGWGKGVAFVNGFNLGRYWPVIGPQITLYVPKEVIKTGQNHIVFIEYQKAPESGEITFTDVPNLDGHSRTLYDLS